MEKEAPTKLLALSFDDGPGPYTLQLLDVLEENDAKGTFFLIGSNMERYPETVQAIYDRGHQLGNHTYSHEVLTGKSEEEVMQQIERTQTLLDAVCGEGTVYALRPPCGECSRLLQHELPYPSVLWAVDTMDWRDKDAELVAKRICDGAFDGAIVLCHDIYETTVQGVAMAAKELKKQGYELVTVNELFRRRGVKLQAGSSYGKCRPTGTALPGLTPPRMDTAATPYGTEVTLSSAYPIWYTLDGSIPTAQSPIYHEPICLQEGQKLCAVTGAALNGSRSEPVRMDAAAARPDSGQSLQFPYE